MKKRFWTSVEVVAEGDGFAVTLDGRKVKTPAKVDLVLPNRALAETVAEEWRAVEAEIDPSVMHFTRLCNAAIDKVGIQHIEIVEMLAAYGETDLLCHRADSPDALADRQAAAWDPVLQWARDVHGLKFEVVAGVLPGTQPAESITGLADWLSGKCRFSLMAIHDLTTISGSVLLAWAVDARQISARDAWVASRIDEVWQEEQWGIDSAASKVSATKQAEFLRAARLLEMVSGDGHA